jgi:hypothetical protein
LRQALAFGFSIAGFRIAPIRETLLFSKPTSPPPVKVLEVPQSDRTVNP